MFALMPSLLAAGTLAVTPGPAHQQPQIQGAATERAAEPLQIRHDSFTLANGLRVVVHTDRRNPVVAVGIWYGVGSADEPAGMTGFAHLFEHLMFNGSENAPGDFFAPLKEMGATQYNGTTFFDRTNYYETVPTNALARTLFLESDRMGWLLGAVTQRVLDVQRGVVQNEKRQRDNQPYGLTEYSRLAGLFPPGHPYAHSPIGSMADLDAASLDDVKTWFRSHYGPNNAVLVLSGDVDLKTARQLAERFFGSIPRSPQNKPVAAPPIPLAQPREAVMHDRVANLVIDRTWPVAGFDDADSVTLDLVGEILGGLASSRLKEALVRQDRLAVDVSAANGTLAHAGMFDLRLVLRPGVDPKAATARMDAILAEFLASGPTEDEVRRAATATIARTIESLESVSAKAQALAEGALYANDPDFYRKRLEQLARETPASVAQAARRWLARPAYTLTVVPGPRENYVEAAPSTPAVVAAETPRPAGTRGAWPALGKPLTPAAPKISRRRLSNGAELVHVRATAVPFTRIILSFDAGTAADPEGAAGLQQLTLAALTEGTSRRDARTIAREQERLGATIGAGSSADRSTIALSVPSANLAQATELLADVALHPAFTPDAVDRVRAGQLARIAQEAATPAGIAARTIAPLVHGADSPYGRARGSGDAAAVKGFSPADLAAFHAAWFRPEKARIFVASDLPARSVQRLLDHAFADWKPTGPAGAKAFPADARPAAPVVMLVDRPDSPQSYVMAAFPTGAAPAAQDGIAAEIANDALGGDFLSRLNMDLREDKHWSYGVRGNFRPYEHAMPYMISTAVQADHTADAVALLRRDIAAFLTAEPMTQAELDRTVADEIRSLPGAFASSDALLAGMQRNALLGRPDDYEQRRARSLPALTPNAANAAIRKLIDPASAIWVIVGDVAVIGPQFTRLGIPWQAAPTPDSVPETRP